MKKLHYILIFLFSVFSFGQETVVSGFIIDKKSGEPIVGATVLVNKTHNGVMTDFEGKYSIKTAINDTLVFSLAGMKMQKIKVDKEEINIELEESEKIVEVFGPPIRPKKSLINSVTTVTTKEIQQEIQQEKIISGKITSEEEINGMIGVIIKNKTTNTITGTDYYGQFVIRASKNDDIVISCPNMLTIEFKVTDKKNYDIFLEKYVLIFL